MNYGSYQNYNSCCQPDACQVRFPYACCGATIPTLEPLIPVAETRRRSKIPRKSCVATTNRVSGMKKKQAHDKDSSRLREDCNVQKETSFDETSHVSRNGLQHPDDCGCAECYVTEADDNCDGDTSRKSLKKSLIKESCSNTNSMAAKSMSNFCYDNPELRESKIKKSSSKIDYADDDMEVWLFQCPKNVDPNQLLSCELAKMGKKTSGPKLECYADRYDEKKTLAVISPMKAAEYEMVCDNIQLIKPVGKICVKEVHEFDKQSSRVEVVSDDAVSPNCESEEDQLKTEDDCVSSDQDSKPIAGKKMKKKLNDQKFTIETTVTVQNMKKKGRKGKDVQCLSIVPPEPSPEKKKKKSKEDWKC